MSNRTFWFLSAVASSIIACAAFMVPATNSNVANPTTPAETTMCYVDTGDEVDLPPGQPLEWYEKNFDKNSIEKNKLAACFAKDTPSDVVQFVEQEIYEANSRYQLNTRWSGAQGTPRALTWSLVPDGVNIPNGVGEPAAPSNLFATLDGQFAAQGGRATWIARIQACFDRWQQLSGLTYTRVTFGGNDWDDGAAMFGSTGAAGLRGDCRISMKNIDGASNILAYNFFPPSGGDMVLDASENWSQGSPGQNRFFRNIIAHEHGHGMGLSHVCPAIAAKLMEPFLSTSYDGPRHDDVRAAQRHYGDVSGLNNSSATAIDIGALPIGTPVVLGSLPNPPSGASPINSSTLSIDANGEIDYYRFSVPRRGYLSILVTPQGQSYAGYAQDANCNNNVANTNSLAMANLAFDLLKSDGVTSLATISLQPAGGIESLMDFPIANSGTYYLRVYEIDSPSQSQLYTARLTFSIPPPSAEIIDTGVVGP